MKTTFSPDDFKGMSLPQIADLINKSIDEIWEQAFKLRVTSWVAFKRLAEVLRLLLTRYEEQRLSIDDFFKRAQKEIGYSRSYVRSILKMESNKDVMSLPNDIASLIDRNALIFMSRDRTKNHYKYKDLRRWVRTTAASGEEVKYFDVRKFMYPLEVAFNRRQVFKANGEDYEDKPIELTVVGEIGSNLDESDVYDFLRSVIKGLALYEVLPGDKKKKRANGSKRIRRLDM